MLQSMTSFISYDFELDGHHLTWEIRTVNHRYLDMQFKLPDTVHSIEPHLRQTLKKYISRGKVDSLLKCKSGSFIEETGFTLNKSLLNSLLKATHEINEMSGEQINSELKAIDILRWPGMLSVEAQGFNGSSDELNASFECAIKQLVKVREQEGQALANFILDRLDSIVACIDSIASFVPNIISMQEEKLRERLQAFAEQLDEARLEQELVYLAQKLDVEEELSRLLAHTQKIRETVQSHTEHAICTVGKTLDFYLQELNREANTICSKSQYAGLSQDGVSLKVYIEQIREQVQNLQ